MSQNEDSTYLASLGYKPELSRRLGGFSNFAISFSIICILAGGITSFSQGLSSVGGASIGIGWPVSCLFSLFCALAMGQIASSFPTAGGLYHWSTALGGRGWGWLTAWFNLAGLVVILAAINVGAWQFIASFLGPFLGIKVEALTTPLAQAIAVGLITLGQALVNHQGIKLTAKLTDFSGYLIFAVTVALVLSLLIYSPSLEFSRLYHFDNFSGSRGGDVWPKTEKMGYLFLLGLLLPAYTITGFDASAHVSEETVDARRAVPRGIVRSVLISGLAGWVLVSTIVLAAPSVEKAAAQGGNCFFWILDSTLPLALRMTLYGLIALAQLLCGLATLTSTSRMLFAFARDGGVPFSRQIRLVSPKTKVPASAIWVSAILSFCFTLYTPVYSTLTVVCVIFLYLSYVMPVALGLIAYGRSWNNFGPWNLGITYVPIAIICIIGCGMIFYIGVQPPNEKAISIMAGTFLLTAVVWFGLERKRFPGPPRKFF
jgi:amino acid transporter